eukprot:ctg_2168.g345
MLARNVASGNEAERFVHDQYARLATELVAWRLRVALSEAVDAPSVHRVFRFADPRTLAAIAAVWEVHGLPEADLPYAQTFLEECRRRGALWAAVIAHETFFAGGGTSREELFEAILRTRKFELADECVQLWGDARMAAALERQREEANAALRAPPSPPAARSEADWAHAVARLHAKKVAEQTRRNDGATTTSNGYVEWPDSRSRALPRLRVPPHVQVRMVQQVAQVHELAAYMRAYEEQGRSASPPPNPSPCRRLPVGLDVEWRPVLDSGREPHCSLLQVATDTQVFLVDLLSADRDAAFREALDETLQHVLRSDRLLKLGFGFAADLQRLHRCRPSMSCFWVAAPAMDLDRVQAPESPEEAVSVGYPHKRGRVVGGLAGLAATLLREALDKQDQCSDWQQRPLTDQQVEYAVLDGRRRGWGGGVPYGGRVASARARAGAPAAGSVCGLERLPYTRTAAAIPTWRGAYRGSAPTAHSFDCPTAGRIPGAHRQVCGLVGGGVAAGAGVHGRRAAGAIAAVGSGVASAARPSADGQRSRTARGDRIRAGRGHAIGRPVHDGGGCGAPARSGAYRRCAVGQCGRRRRRAPARPLGVRVRRQRPADAPHAHRIVVWTGERHSIERFGSGGGGGRYTSATLARLHPRLHNGYRLWHQYVDAAFLH